MQSRTQPACTPINKLLLIKGQFPDQNRDRVCSTALRAHFLRPAASLHLRSHHHGRRSGGSCPTAAFGRSGPGEGLPPPKNPPAARPPSACPYTQVLFSNIRRARTTGGGRRPNGFLTTVAKRCPCCAADGTPGQQAGKVRSAEGRRGRTRPSVLQPARCEALPRQGAVAARNRAARRVPGRGALGAGAHLSRDAAWKTSAGRECLALAAACTAPCFPAPFIPGLFRRMVISAAKALVLTSVPHRQSLRRARALGSASLNDFGRNASVPGAPGLGQRLPSIRGCSTDLIAKFILRARWEKLQKHQLLWRAWSLLFSLLLAHS